MVKARHSHPCVHGHPNAANMSFPVHRLLQVSFPSPANLLPFTLSAIPASPYDATNSSFTQSLQHAKSVCQLPPKLVHPMIVIITCHRLAIKNQVKGRQKGWLWGERKNKNEKRRKESKSWLPESGREEEVLWFFFFSF